MAISFPGYLDFENIVRPALPMRAGRYVRDARIPADREENPEIKVEAGSLRDVDGQFMNWGFTTKVEEGETYNEDKKKRDTELVRIEDPDDPDVYVEVERMRRATFTDEQTGRTMTLKFDTWDDERS